MSLYREPGRRRVWPAAVAAVVLVLVFVLGFALGRAGAEPSLEDALDPTRERTAEVLAALEQLTIEYPQGAEAASEYEGASATAERMQDAFAEARDDLLVLDADRTREAEATLNEVAAIVERRESATELEAVVRRAEEAVRGLPTAG
jgi:hypothetical protein